MSVYASDVGWRSDNRLALNLTAASAQTPDRLRLAARAAAVEMLLAATAFFYFWRRRCRAFSIRSDPVEFAESRTLRRRPVGGRRLIFAHCNTSGTQPRF